MKPSLARRVARFFSDYPFVVPLLMFSVLYFFIGLYQYSYQFFVWDEAVYIGIAKFFYSGGSMGFFEVLRAPLLPLILGIFWKAGMDPLLFKLFFPFISLGVLYITYIIGWKTSGNRITGVAAASILGISPVFFLNSAKILTDTPSTGLILISTYFFLKKKHLFSGLLAGLAFLMRFSQGLFAAAIAIYLVVLLLYYKETFKSVFRKGMMFGAGFIMILLPFLVINYIIYRPETNLWWHAAFRPLIFASNTIYLHAVHLYSQSPWYYLQYFILQNATLLFAAAGLAYFLRRLKQYRETCLLFVVLVVFLIYYSLTPHKELRYGLAFLPFLALFAGYGVGFLLKTRFVKRLRIARRTGAHIILALFLILLAVLVGVNFKMAPGMQDHASFSENYLKYLDKNPVSGNVISTIPHIALYIDNPILFSTHLPTLKQYLRQEHNAVLLTEGSLVCNPGDVQCEKDKQFCVESIIKNQNLVNRIVFQGTEYYIFSNVDYLPKLSNYALLKQYGLIQPLTLSEYPVDRFPVMIVMEDFPSIEDIEAEDASIWKEGAYLRVLEVIENNSVPVSVAAIPKHYARLTSHEINRLSRLDLLQNGYSHIQGDLLQALESQQEKIALGKEMLEGLSSRKIRGFIPPFYSANEDTASALSKLGYEIYVTSYGDEVDIEMDRYHQTLSLFHTWSNEDLKTIPEISSEIERIKLYEDYILFSYYYFYDSLNASYFVRLLDLFENMSLMSVSDYHAWQELRHEVDFRIEGDNIYLHGPETENSEFLTLIAITGGNYTLDTGYPRIRLKSKADQDIDVCVNNDCVELMHGGSTILVTG